MVRADDLIAPTPDVAIIDDGRLCARRRALVPAHPGRIGDRAGRRPPRSDVVSRMKTKHYEIDVEGRNIQP